MTEEKYSLEVLDTPQKKDDFIRYMIKNYSKKESHKEQSDLPERCFSIVIDYKANDKTGEILGQEYYPLYMIQKQLGNLSFLYPKLDKKTNIALHKASKKLIAQYPEDYEINIHNTIEETQKHSTKPSFISVVFKKHCFGIVVFNDNISIIDTGTNETGLCFEELLNIINDKYYNNKFTINYISLRQQSEPDVCPYFTAYNITQLDKLFYENYKEFCKLINAEKDIKIPPQFVINTTQSLTGIEIQTGLMFELLDTNTPINSKDIIEKDNFFSEKIVVDKSDSKINFTNEDLRKMVKYFTYKEHTNQYDKTENKLQNLRVYYKSRDILIKFLEANKDFTQQEEVAQSPAK